MTFLNTCNILNESNILKIIDNSANKVDIKVSDNDFIKRLHKQKIV
jgi:hypothetical protein